jgi:gas vesicle protein
MTGPTIGQQLDATLANLVTKDDITDLKAELKADMAGLKSELKAEMKAFVTHEQLNTIIKAAVRELVQVINQNTEDLREDLNDAGIKIRTKVRDRSGYSSA